MEFKTADRSAWGSVSAPVVLRVRQQSAGSRPARGRRPHARLSAASWIPRWRGSQLWRSDHLILWASLPLVTLVIYLGWQMVTSTEAESSLRPKTLSLPTNSVPEIAHDRSGIQPSSASGANAQPSMETNPPMELRPSSRTEFEPLSTPSDPQAPQKNEDLPILPAEEDTVRPTQGHSWSTDEENVEQAVVRPGDQPLRLGRAEAIPTHVGRISSVQPSHPSGHSERRLRPAIEPVQTSIPENWNESAELGSPE